MEALNKHGHKKEGRRLELVAAVFVIKQKAPSPP